MDMTAGERRGEGMAEGRGGVRSKDRLQRAGVTDAAVPPCLQYLSLTNGDRA